MADDRRHPPSERKLRKARERGDIPQSRELTAAVSLLACLATIGYNLPPATREFVEIVSRCFAYGAQRPDPPPDQVVTFAGVVLAHGLLLAAPVIGASMVAGVLASVVQSKPIFTLEPLALKPEKLNPFTGLARRVLSRDAMIELIKALLKMAIVTIVATATLRANWREIVRSADSSPAAAATMVRDVSLSMGYRVCAVLMALGLVDWLYQRWSWKKRNFMTDEEYRNELKDDQTNPEVLRRRAQRRDELRTAQMIERIGDADFGTLNPTHIACFLRYDPGQEDAPRVIAKGRGWVAQQLIDAARRRGIPMARRPTLARAIFKLRVNSQIPRELHLAVATLMNWLEKSAEDRGKTTRWSQRRAARTEVSENDLSTSSARRRIRNV